MAGNWWLWLWILVTLCPGPVLAGDLDAIKKTMEMSMLVTGTIDVRSDGSVAAHAIDKESQLPPSIAEVVHRAAPDWRFEPVELGPGVDLVRARMTLRLVARPRDDHNFEVRVGSASFHGDSPADRAVRSREMRPPRYPFVAVSRGIAGTVYTAVKIGRDGVVQDAVVERVDLLTLHNPEWLPEFREILGRATLYAARRWTFEVDTEDPYTTVRVPVEYSLGHHIRADYGQWQTYLPGPVSPIPWVDDAAEELSDALVAGGVYPVDSDGLRLLTPLGS